MVVPREAMPPGGDFCALPGSVLFTAQGHAVVPGGDPSLPDITWLTLPVGFCAHYFATVKTVRQLRFAPGGDLFAASPSQITTGGAGDGTNEIVVLPDDDHDGVADNGPPYTTFLSNLPATQGLMFAGGYLYYQDRTLILRVPFHAGDRTPSASPQTLINMADHVSQAGEHWPKVMDVARDGTLYVSNGSTQSELCSCGRPMFGGIFKLNGDNTVTPVSKGFRNPIALRCEVDHDVCLAAELALDYSATSGGREKIVPVRQGDDWGYPCCGTQNVPYSNVTCQETGGLPDCSGVAAENASFVIGHTPFGLDFETGKWPAPWAHRVFVTLHGEAGTWLGARLVAIALDPQSGLPLPASELPGDAGDPTNLLEFATGWDTADPIAIRTHGRPAPVTFAPDGRLFLGDDQKGAVIWIAPVGLMRP
jgi:glucose/arabinose dehydrogenase